MVLLLFALLPWVTPTDWNNAMPLVIPSGYAEITVVLSPPGDLSPSTVSWGTNGVTDASSLLDAVQAHRDAWFDTDSFGDSLASTWTTIQFEGRTDPGGSNLVVVVPENTAGGGGPDCLPSNCACLIRKVTGLGGRAKRGRMYIPGILGEANVDAMGTIDGATLVDLGTNCTTFLTACIAASFPLYLFHSDQVRNPALPAPAMMANPDPTPTLITDLVPDGRIATQRRRMR